MLANDSSVLITTSTGDELNHISNSVLLHISKWFQVNQFVLNAHKTHAVQFTAHKVCYYPLNLTYADQILVKTSTVKFLGLQLDSHRTWMTYINSLLRKLSTVYFIMRRLSHILNIDTLRIVYAVHFHTLIKYSIIFWGTSTTMHKVFLIQKRIIRIMLGIGPRTSCRTGLRNLTY
jgi:hypothetical protein